MRSDQYKADPREVNFTNSTSKSMGRLKAISSNIAVAMSKNRFITLIFKKTGVCL